MRKRKNISQTFVFLWIRIDDGRGDCDSLGDGDGDFDSLGDGLGSKALDSLTMLHTKLQSLGWTTL